MIAPFLVTPIGSKYGYGSEKSSIFTTWYNSLEDPFHLGVNSVFLAPSLTNFMPRFALATPRFARTTQVGFALHKILSSGAKKTEFTPRKNGSPSFSYQVVKKGLLLTTFAHFSLYCSTSKHIKNENTSFGVKNMIFIKLALIFQFFSKWGMW